MPDPTRPDAPRDASVLAAIERLGGEAPKVMLRDSPAEHGETPLIDAASPEARQLPKARASFQFLGEIARGGMGIILKGHDRDLGRDVAVKVLRKEFAQKPEVLQRFVEEAQIGGQLQHPGIVPVYEMGLLADERPFFAMKLVKGRTLGALLADRATPDADRPRHLAIFEAVCQTMGYAHSRGVIHRDLKPANVMVGAFGEVQVVDWGLAKVLAQGGVHDERREKSSQASIIATIRHQPGSTGSDSLAGSVMGTPSYMPPEQARGEIGRLDERSDVFSLGAMLCEILTGTPPYTGSADVVLGLAADAALADATARLDACAADPVLVALVKRCLAPAPAARPRHAGVLAQELAAWRDSVERRARDAEISAAEARVKADDERRARRLTFALASAVVLIVVLCGGGWLVWNATHAEWRSQNEERVHAALAEATLSRGQKRWQDATVAIEQAVALADAGPVGDELRARVTREAATVAQERSAAAHQVDIERQNRELLEHLRLHRSLEIGDDELAAYFDETYVDAFNAFGLDLDALPVADAARVLKERGIAVPIAAALDDWASARRRGEHPDDAEHLTQIALAADPDETRTRLRRAIAIGDISLLREFVRLEDLKTLPATSLNLLATGFKRAGDARQSVEILSLARTLHPDDFVVNFNLGTGLRFSDPPRFEEALECWSAALAVQPNVHTLAATMGLVLTVHLGNPVRGLALCRGAAEADPSEAWVHMCYAWSLESHGEWEPAIVQHRAALSLEPDERELKLNLGTSLFEQGEFVEAIAIFRDLTAHEPANEVAHARLAAALLETGDVAAALAESAVARSLGSRQLDSTWISVRARAAAGDLDGANQMLDHVIAHTGPSADSQDLLARELSTQPNPQLRRPSIAVVAAKRATEIEPRTGARWLTLAIALLRSDDATGCVEAAERSMRFLAGGDARHWFALAIAKQKLGDGDAARESLRRGVEWMEQRRCRNREMRLLRQEAEALLKE